MSEEMARALGAKGPTPITIAGKECLPRALGLQELTEVERDCLEQCRRRYLEGWSHNLDMLPEASRSGVMERKIEEAARWDVSDLPPKRACDPDRVALTPELSAWLLKEFPDLSRKPEGVEQDVWEKTSGRRSQVMAAVALDQGMLDEADWERMTGGRPGYVKLGYVNWWITGCYDGMISFVACCFRHYGVTKEQVVEAFRGNIPALAEVCRDIERLSAPSGNG